MTVRAIKVKGEQLSFLAHADSAEQLITGATTGETPDSWNFKVEGTYVYWVDYAGDERRKEGTLTGNSRTAGDITVHGELLYYGDYAGAERSLSAVVVGSEILRPNGAGDLSEFSTIYPDTGEAAWEDVDEASPDGDSSYIETGDVHAEVQASLFTIGASSIPPTATISSIQVHNYVRRTGGWTINYFHHLIKIGDTVYDSANLPCFQGIVHETYRDLSSNWYAPACGWSGKWSINPATLVAWTVADLAGLQIGVRSYTRDPYPVSPSRARVSQVYLIINYTY